MNRPALSALRPGVDRRPFSDVDRDRFFGLVSVSVGLSLALVSLTLLFERPVTAFPVGAGGWMLVAIGSNLLLDREAFHSDWTEDGEPGWVSMTVVALATVAIVAAALISVVSG